MNIESDDKEELKARRNVYLTWVAKIDEQIAELEKPKEWEPKSGKWVISSNGRVMKTITMTKSQLFGTERQTEEQAEKAAVAMRRFNRLLAYRDEFAPGYIFQCGGVNCYVYANDRDWFVDRVSITLAPAQVYFPMNVADELCRKLKSGEVIL